MKKSKFIFTFPSDISALSPINMKRCLLLCFFGAVAAIHAGEESSRLFEDLALVESINQSLLDHLPRYYNFNTLIGYLNIPSARMNPVGTLAFSGSRVYPYNNWGVNFQLFQRLELAANYASFTSIPPEGLALLGFDEDDNLIGHLKFGLLTPEDGFEKLPLLAVGVEDFFSSHRPMTHYLIATQCFLSLNLEASLGFGNKNRKGLFGALSWTPFRNHPFFLLKDFTLLAEYDPATFRVYSHKHPEGKKISQKINAGISFSPWKMLQFKVGAMHGRDLAASASFHYPLGSSSGLFTKSENPNLYASPQDNEPLGFERPEKVFAQELALALKQQRIDLFEVFLLHQEGQKTLWVKIINMTYRDKDALRERLQHVFATLLPDNITVVEVVIEADGIPCYRLIFRKEDLQRLKMRLISSSELEALSPLKEVGSIPNEYEAELLFKKKKDTATFLFRPRFLSFFGEEKGNFQYNFSLIAAPEGYLFNTFYYKVQMRETLLSSKQPLLSVQPKNPSHLPNVRTDTVHYYQQYSFALEEGFIQLSRNLNKGWYARAALGYFEPAYGGAALEFLYFPLKQNWAIGIEEATVWKRQYTGLGFKNKIRRYKKTKALFEPFIGVQYFLDLYYIFKPLKLDFKWQVGQFLAKDIGLRTEIGRTYENGIRIGLWYTITNGHDKVNNKTFYDKGFVFSIPLDFFLKKSSRKTIGYPISSWLRDVGAEAATGKKLWPTLYEERY